MYVEFSVIGIVIPLSIACFHIKPTIYVSLNFQYSLHSDVSLFVDKLLIVRFTFYSFWEITKKFWGEN